MKASKSRSPNNGLVSIPYRQCLSKLGRDNVLEHYWEFQFLIGNVLAIH